MLKQMLLLISIPILGIFTGTLSAQNAISINVEDNIAKKKLKRPLRISIIIHQKANKEAKTDQELDSETYYQQIPYYGANVSCCGKIIQ